MKLLCTLFLVAFSSFVSLAQDNTLDLTFNPTDIGLKNGDGPYDKVTDPQTYINRIAIQSDGKILIGGKFTEYNGYACKAFIRLNTDGTFDTTFNLGVKVNGVQAIVVQTDGKIIIGGLFTDLNGYNPRTVVRLNSDGSLDATFNVTVGQESWVTLTDLVLQPDGKVLIANNNYPYLVRVDGNGVQDSTFNSAGVQGGQINSIALQSDGKLIVGGSFTSFSGGTTNKLARVNSDGSLDAAFNTSVGADNSVRKVLVLPNDKIVMIGTFYNYNGVYRPLIARLNSDGVLDTTFDPGYFNQTGTTPFLAAIELQTNGKLFVVGKYNLHGSTPLTASAMPVSNMVRLNPNGSRDTTYSIAGTDNYIYALAVQSNGSIIVGGEFETHDNVARHRISRSQSNGTIDMFFNTGSGTNPAVSKVKVLTDDKILISGAFRLYNGVVRNRIAKLNVDGTLDSSFNSSLLINGGIDSFDVQSDGKIIIGGNFTSIGGLTRNRIARLNPDGSFENSFTIGSGFNGTWISGIALQNDGKIIVTGNFTTYNAVACNRIVRLNTNGSLDTTFNVGSGANDTVSNVAIQSDGKIIIGGVFSTFNGITKKGIVRLNSDGSIDASFSSGTGLDGNAVVCIKELSNGKILVTSGSQTYNGVSVGSMFRLNSNGSLDATFVNVGNYRTYTNFIVQSDGKILTICKGPDVLGYIVYYLNRLNSNGEFDSSFAGGDIPTAQFERYQPVHSLGLQSNGKIIVGGNFNSFKGQGKNRVARINNTVVLGVDDFSQNDRNIVVYKENNNLYINSKGKILRVVMVYDLNGKLLYENKNINTSIVVLDEIKFDNQVLLFKFIDSENRVSNLKSVF